MYVIAFFPYTVMLGLFYQHGWAILFCHDLTHIYIYVFDTFYINYNVWPCHLSLRHLTNVKTNKPDMMSGMCLHWLPLFGSLHVTCHMQTWPKSCRPHVNIVTCFVSKRWGLWIMWATCQYCDIFCKQEAGLGNFLPKPSVMLELHWPIHLLH